MIKYSILYRKENEKRIVQLFKKLIKINKQSNFKARVILESIESSLENEETTDELFCLINKNNAEKIKLDEINNILNIKSSLKNKKYIHYANRKTYKIVAVSIPVANINKIYDCTNVFHTEDEKLLNVYSYGNFYFHNYNDEVLVVYTDGKKMYGRPYEMFFSDVLDENDFQVKRFVEISE